MADFTKDLPSGALPFNQGDNDIRANNQALEERLSREHDFPQNPFTTRSGRHIFGVGTTAQRGVAITLPQSGNVWYNTDTVGWEVYDGSSWEPGIFSLNPEQVDDTSANNAEQDVMLAPGSYAARSLATDHEEELWQLRYAQARQSIGVGALRNAGADSVGWIEAPARGQSRVLNGRFVAWDGVAGNAPDGWTKVGAPTTCEVLARSAVLGLGLEIHIVSNAAGQGWSQVITGLRAETRYLLRVRCRVNSGSLQITTLGGTGGEYGNHLATITGSTDVDTIGVILTDGTPTNITIRGLSLANGDDFRTSEVDLLPIGDVPVTSLELPQSWSKWLHVEVSQVVTVAAGATPLTGLQDLRVWVPGPGYVIDVEAQVSAASTNDSDTVGTVELEQSFNDGAYATITGSRVGITSIDNSYPATSSTKVLIVDPAVGSYEFRVVVIAKRNSMEFQPVDVDIAQCASKLIATLRRQQG